MAVWFREELKVKNWWFRILPWIVLGMAGYITVMQLIFDQPVGDQPLPNSRIWTIWLAGGLVLLTVRMIRLVTILDDTGIHVRFIPFSSRTYLWEEIRNVRISRYDPFLDPNNYGFWLLKRNRTYNVEGRFGLELQCYDGHRIVIGTNRKDELVSVLSSRYPGISRQ